VVRSKELVVWGTARVVGKRLLWSVWTGSAVGSGDQQLSRNFEI
jgi:hypothetical protein